MVQKFYRIKPVLVKACEKDPYFWVHMRIVMNNCYNRWDSRHREYDAWQLHKYMPDEETAKYILDNIEEAGFITRQYEYDKNLGVYGCWYKVNVNCAEVQYFELMMKNVT